MVRNLGENKVLWRLTAVLSLIVALVGVFSPGIYSKVISTELMPAVFGQDWITVVASVIILLLAVRIKEEDSNLFYHAGICDSRHHGSQESRVGTAFNSRHIYLRIHSDFLACCERNGEAVL